MAYYFPFINPFSLSIGSVYMQYANLIDSILAFIIFLSISQWVFTRKYKAAEGKSAKEAKMIAVGVSLALTFGFAMFELTTGFNFGKMDALAAILLLLIFGVLVYELIVGLLGEEKKRCAAAFAYFLMHSMFMVPFSNLYNLVANQYPMVWSILGVIYIISLITVFICIFSNLGSKSKGGNDGQREDPDAPKLPLRVQITSPSNNSRFPEGADIQVEATITGGSGNYVWNFEPSQNCTPLQGMGATASTTVRGLTTSTNPYIIEVIAQDGHSRHQAGVEIRIDQGQPQQLDIVIDIPPNDAPDPAALRRQSDPTPLAIRGYVRAPAGRYNLAFAFYDMNGARAGNWFWPGNSLAHGQPLAHQFLVDSIPLTANNAQPQLYRLVLFATPGRIPYTNATLPQTLTANMQRQERIIRIDPPNVTAQILVTTSDSNNAPVNDAVIELFDGSGARIDGRTGPTALFAIQNAQAFGLFEVKVTSPTKGQAQHYEIGQSGQQPTGRLVLSQTQPRETVKAHWIANNPPVILEINVDTADRNNLSVNDAIIELYDANGTRIDRTIGPRARFRPPRIGMYEVKVQSQSMGQADHYEMGWTGQQQNGRVVITAARPSWNVLAHWTGTTPPARPTIAITTIQNAQVTQTRQASTGTRNNPIIVALADFIVRAQLINASTNFRTQWFMQDVSANLAAIPLGTTTPVASGAVLTDAIPVAIPGAHNVQPGLYVLHAHATDTHAAADDEVYIQILPPTNGRVLVRALVNGNPFPDSMIRIFAGTTANGPPLKQSAGPETSLDVQPGQYLVEVISSSAQVILVNYGTTPGGTTTVPPVITVTPNSLQYVVDARFTQQPPAPQLPNNVLVALGAAPNAQFIKSINSGAVSGLQGETHWPFQVKLEREDSSISYAYTLSMAARVNGETRRLVNEEMADIGVTLTGSKTLKRTNDSINLSIALDRDHPADRQYILMESKNIRSSKNAKVIFVNMGRDRKLESESAFTKLHATELRFFIRAIAMKGKEAFRDGDDKPMFADIEFALRPTN